MKRGHQWIHFDAQFPLKFGHDLLIRFGPAGQLLFVQFLCACKRSYPQGQIHYRTEDELRVLLGAHYSFVDDIGDKWTLREFWTWCGRRRVTRTKTRDGRTYVTAARWNTWEDAHNVAERQRKSRQKRRSEAMSPLLSGPDAKSEHQLASEHDQNTNQQAQTRRSEIKSIRDRHAQRGEGGGVSKSPPTPSCPTSDDTTSAERRGNVQRTTKDPLVEWIRTCVPGTGAAAAQQTIERLRRAGVGDVVIEEAAGYAAQHGGNSARYVEQVATDWMTQRDPTWNGTTDG